MRLIVPCVFLLLLTFLSMSWVADAAPATESTTTADARAALDERPHDPYLAPESHQTNPARRWRNGPYVSIQVNVDDNGNNILNDAANEPSIAIDPKSPERIAIGWRQFDNIKSNFRQAGWGYSSDGGNTWHTSVIEPGVFRTEPVLTFDADGNFYFNSVSALANGNFQSDIFRSSDGGTTWDEGVFAGGGPKPWLAIDRTDGIGAGHIYNHWYIFGGCCGPDNFIRSVDGGDTYGPPTVLPEQFLIAGTSDVGPGGEVYVTGREIGTAMVAKSTTMKDPGLPLAFDSITVVPIGLVSAGNEVNPQGLPGQLWVVTDHSDSLRRGWVYLLATVVGPNSTLDLHFSRSTDGGATWSPPLRVNDDAIGTATQWFGTLAIAPNGRLDMVWNDTRNSGGTVDSELFYSFSVDGGETWSPNRPVSPSFNPHLGWPNQKHIGDYYDMISDNDAAHVAYAATFNGEQDIYYLRIVPEPFVFADGFESGDISAWSGSSIP